MTALFDQDYVTRMYGVEQHKNVVCCYGKFSRALAAAACWAAFLL